MQNAERSAGHPLANRALWWCPLLLKGRFLARPESRDTEWPIAMGASGQPEHPQKWEGYGLCRQAQRPYRRVAAELGRGARVPRCDIEAAELLAAAQIPDPVAAATTLEGRVKTGTGGHQQGAVAAAAVLPWSKSSHIVVCLGRCAAGAAGVAPGRCRPEPIAAVRGRRFCVYRRAAARGRQLPFLAKFGRGQPSLGRVLTGLTGMAACYRKKAS